MATTNEEFKPTHKHIKTGMQVIIFDGFIINRKGTKWEATNERLHVLQEIVEPQNIVNDYGLKIKKLNATDKMGNRVVITNKSFGWRKVIPFNYEGTIKDAAMHELNENGIRINAAIEMHDCYYLTIKYQYRSSLQRFFEK